MRNKVSVRVKSVRKGSLHVRQEEGQCTVQAHVRIGYCETGVEENTKTQEQVWNRIGGSIVGVDGGREAGREGE